jgi:NTP pyrophosphatase (non-canonical NTP hydrolase)
MNLSSEFSPIEDWANDKKIITEGNVFRQYTKFQEEAGELAKALIKHDKVEVIDAIGDIVVTLVSLSKQAAILFEDDAISIEACINSAYAVIKNRTGKCIDGDFIKDK